MQAPVGVSDGPLLLGVGLGREDDVRVPLGRRAEKLLVDDDERGLSERLVPPLALGQLANGIAVEQVERADFAASRGLARLVGRRSGVRVGQAEAERRAASNLAKTPPIGCGRDLDQARALAGVQPEHEPEVSERAEGGFAFTAVTEPLARNHDNVLGLSEKRGRLAQSPHRGVGWTRHAPVGTCIRLPLPLGGELLVRYRVRFGRRAPAAATA